MESQWPPIVSVNYVRSICHSLCKRIPRIVRIVFAGISSNCATRSNKFRFSPKRFHSQTPLFERKNSFRCLESNFHRFQPNFDQTNLERFDRDSFPASSESSRLTLRKASRAKQPQISAASRRLRKNSWWSCISWIVDADVLREE